MHRFDHHRPPATGGAAEDPDGRSVLYFGATLAIAASEVFGETGEARLCPNYRVAIVRPPVRRAPRLLDLGQEGVAMTIGATSALANGDFARALTQQWATAIFEDQPTGAYLDGIRYSTGYTGGIALAIWDRQDIEVVTTSAGPQDYPLNHASVLPRLIVQMRQRNITPTLVDSMDCNECQKAPPAA